MVTLCKKALTRTAIKKTTLRQSMTETKHEAQLGRLRQILREHDVDAVLVSNPTNSFYLTDFKGVGPQERETCALVTPDVGAACGDPVAIT
jgi:Xaa-Pro aminopeptidase